MLNPLQKFVLLTKQEGMILFSVSSSEYQKCNAYKNIIGNYWKIDERIDLFLCMVTRCCVLVVLVFEYVRIVWIVFYHLRVSFFSCKKFLNFNPSQGVPGLYQTVFFGSCFYKKNYKWRKFLDTNPLPPRVLFWLGSPFLVILFNRFSDQVYLHLLINSFYRSIFSFFEYFYTFCILVFASFFFLFSFVTQEFVAVYQWRINSKVIIF